MQLITTIGLDIAKSVFQVHSVNAECSLASSVEAPPTCLMAAKANNDKLARVPFPCRTYRTVCSSLDLD
jgi:hypothetical protein